MSIVLVGSTSGSVTLQEPAVAGTTVLDLPATSGNVVVDTATQTLTNKTLTSPTIGGTPTGVGVLTSGTAATPSAVTFVDFTSIPSWVKRITVMFNGVSLNNTANILIQLGTASGFTSTGYISTSNILNNSSGSSGSSSTSGFFVFDGDASYVLHGTCVISLVSSNSFVSTHSYRVSTTQIILGSGSVSLGDTLNSVRIISSDNTGTFDAGTINILFE
jgi:hypothetical protein